ncbi:MAG: tetratricopeptide repeat protein [Planctomycetales bacterium]|nr:tetratricopeptide repeat protein [Planctomycetales bacterium]
MIIARQLVQQGIDAQTEDDWVVAEERFRSAIKYSPKDHTARVHYAECLWRRGAADDATLELARAIDLSGGTDVDSIARLGQMLKQTGNSASAAKLAQRGLNVDPTNPYAWKLHAELLHESNKLDESLAAYHRALAYAPDDADVRTATAQIYLEANRANRTVAVLERLFRDQGPTAATTEQLHLHGLALAKLQRHDDAIASFQLARQSTDAPSSELYADLAQSQIAVNRLTDAWRSIDDGIRIANSADRGRLEELQRIVVAAQRRDRSRR